MRYMPARALTLLAVASFWSGTACALVSPITIGTDVPSMINVGGTSINIGTDSSASLAARTINTARTVAPAAAADAGAIAEVTDLATVAGPAGELGITMTEAVGADAAAAAIVGCLASVVCGVVAVAAAAVAVGVAAHVACSNGSCSVDQGVPAPQATVSMWAAGTSCQGTDEIAAFICVLQPQFPGATITSPGCDANGCGYYLNNDGIPRYAGFYSTPVSASQCPVVNGVQPAGYMFMGSPVCPGGSLSSDPATVEKQVGSILPANPQQTADAIAQSSAAGIPLTVTPYAITGPDSQPGVGKTSVVTNPDGSQVSTKSQVQYQYYYRPDGIDVGTQTTTTTTTSNPDGTVADTDTNTSTSGPGSAASGVGTGTSAGTGGSSNTPDLCALHPDVLACGTLGTPGTDTPQWTSQTVTFAPEDLGLPSGCPAPRTFTVRGTALAISYQPACDVAPIVAPALIAFTAVGCILWILTALKG